MIRTFIIIDDAPVNNFLSSILLKDTLGAVDIHTFEAPGKGLAYIQCEYGNNPEPAILLLDINMPGLSGWDFMDEYESVSSVIKEHLAIYMFSSLVSDSDQDRVRANKFIHGFIPKPLEPADILFIASQEAIHCT